MAKFEAVTAPQAERASFGGLPDVLLSSVLSCLPRWDVLPLLQVSKRVRRIALSSIEALELDCTAKPETDEGALALDRLLRQATALQRLGVDGALFELPDFKRSLLEAIGDGSLDDRVRQLRLGFLDGELMEFLKAGRLPRLSELCLGSIGDQQALLLAEMLEARRALGLAPLGRVDFNPLWSAVGVTCLRRVLASCPPDAATHVQVERKEQLQVLLEYMEQHAHFPALRRLVFKRGMCDFDPLPQVPAILRVLAQVAAPMLEKLELYCSGSGLGGGDSLARAIREGKLPKLASLGLSGHWPTDDFCSIVDALRQSDLQLADLTLKSHKSRAGIAQECMQHLAEALKAESGGLARLKGLQLDLECDYRPIIKALAWGPAACARTLESLRLAGDACGLAIARQFLGGLRKGAFPCLTTLALCSDDQLFDKRVSEEFVEAVLHLAAKGTPSRLESLQLRVKDSNALLGGLALAFKADALPRLVRFVMGSSGSEYRANVGASFIGEWTALGSKVKLESLQLMVDMPKYAERAFIHALADPAFCPFLRHVHVGERLSEGNWLAQKRLKDQRRQRRDALAASAGAGARGSPLDHMSREEMKARILALEARVRELEQQR